MTRLLMMEGNTLEKQAEASRLGVRNATDVYMRAIRAHFPDLELEVLHAADKGQSLPNGRTLNDYDGMVISGSGLHAYDEIFEVTNQIEWLKTFAQTGKPILGSCWGLQIAVMAAGGMVGLSPNGREVGIARKIGLTDVGKAHPLMAGKPTIFDAPCIHYDEVTVLPEGCTLLASNAHSHVQAAIVPLGKSEVWAVQYHPEFDLIQLSMLLTLYKQNMLDQGFVKSVEELTDYQSKLDDLAANSKDNAASWQLGIDSDIINDEIRRAEIINWVNHVIQGKQNHG